MSIASDHEDPSYGALRLTDWGVIRARGPDARSFLQSQLTQDTMHLPEGQARPAGWCSAKGRLLASFVIWPTAPDELLLACSADLLEATLKRLSMFVLRAKCQLSDASAEVALWGLAGGSPRSMPTLQELAVWQVRRSGDVDTVRLPDARVGDRAVARALLAMPGGHEPPDLPHLDPGLWLALEVRSGVPRIMAATREQFVPQMVNLELVGGVDFRKGCYPGQEVVARSQYRGTLKRRTFIVHGQQAMTPAQEVFHSADPDQPAGMVVLAGRGPDGRHEALVELKLASLASGTLHLGQPQGPLLTVDRLPYEIPAEAA